MEAMLALISLFKLALNVAADLCSVSLKVFESGYRSYAAILIMEVRAWSL